MSDPSGTPTAQGSTQGSTQEDRVGVDHVVVGASSVAATVEFFSALGFVEQERRTVAADAASALYGIDGATEEVVLGMPGADGAGIRVVATPLAQAARDDFFRGGHAIDLYTTDIHRSVDLAAGTGAKVGSVADFEFGPVRLTQAMAVGPDGVDVVFVGINHRLPSRLDNDPEALHSEVHSVVASIDDLAAETAFWTEVVGLDLKSQFPIDVEAVSEFMMLPRHAPMKMTVMTGPGAVPPRFELLAFDDAPGALTPSRPLTAGAIIPVLTAADLDATVARLAGGGAVAGDVVDAAGPAGRSTRAVGLTSPGGVDVELREAGARGHVE
jgi:catechol 2,3-dioxygenase-like lactoylglutathione lyase family enzyme